MITILLCITVTLSIIGIIVINQSKHHSDKNLELLKSKMNDLTQQREQWQQFIMNQQAQQQQCALTHAVVARQHQTQLFFLRESTNPK